MTNEELMIAVHVAAEDAEREIESICERLSRVGQSAEAAGGRVERALSGGALSPMLSALSALSWQMGSIPSATLTVNNSQALSAIDAAMGAVSAFLKLLGAAGLSGEQTKTAGASSGGGGYSRSAAKREQAIRDAQQAQEEAYRSEVARIEHRRRLGEITAQEEIELLERVKRAYAQTAEQVMDIDEAIFDARADLREAEQEKITALGEAVTGALEARHEKQREAEQARIDASIAAWEAWSEETCAAIKKQIDALEEQEEAEAREEQAAKSLRQIDSLKQALFYEGDAYNRAQLDRQIAQAEAAYAELKKQWSREDERAALEAQMQAVEREAEREIELLDEESARIDAVYDALVDGASLAAQAHKTLMESSQSELLALLEAFAPDYEATGRTLGERLYAGFSEAVGDVSAWFDAFDARFEAMLGAAQRSAYAQGQAALSGGAGAAAVHAPQVQQTVNFYQPVESAAEVARRMQRLSEQLADGM